MRFHHEGDHAWMLFVCAVTPLLCLPTLASEAVRPNRESLDAMAVRLERDLAELHVPGLAVALVKGDEVVLLEGFGLADVERKLPVDVDTTFPIGSCTKAFTTTLIGMLVDEGKMAWEDPVVNHLPYFKLQVTDPWSSSDVTIRDLLCHRTGFAFMDLLWLGEPVTREEVLRTATRARHYADFRTEFHYNSVMFTAAGVAAAKVCGSTWDLLVKDRLLDALGMSGADTSSRQSQPGSGAARGYMWLEEHRVFAPFPSRSLASVGPAGAISASASDMARWVRFLLARGVFEGRRLISEAQLQETWTPQIAIREGEMYGLGWVLQEIEGQPVIFHTGGLDGFTSLVALIPEEDVGVALLANVTNAPVLDILVGKIWHAIVTSEHVPSVGSPSAGQENHKRADAPACDAPPSDTSGKALVAGKEPLPSPEDLLALRQSGHRRDAIAKIGTFRLAGSIRLIHAGIEGSVVVHAAGNDRRREETRLSKFGYLSEVIRENTGWAQSSYFPFHELSGAYLDQQRREHPAAIWGDWREFFDQISVLRSDEVDGHRVFVVRLQGDDAPTWTAYVDAKLGDVVKVERDIVLPVGLGTTPATILYSDYRERDGLRIPFRITSTDGFSGTTIVAYDKLETNVDAPADLFVLDRR